MKYPRLRSKFLGTCISALSFFTLPQLASAGIYQLPETGDVIGSIQHITIQSDDTLIDIARRYNIGFNEIKAANPAIDPWLPNDGEQVVIPTQFILPSVPREGIVINLPEMRLYYYPAPMAGQKPVVITHPIGIGRVGWSTPEGEYRIISKIEKPVWKMPESVIEEWLAEGRTPRRFMSPGPDNPLGEYAMGISLDGYYIHGTNKPFSVGMRVSHGCLRLYPEDIAELYQMVERDVPVRIINEPYKFGYENDVMFLEAHAPLDGFFHPAQSHKVLAERALVNSGRVDALSGQRASAIQAAHNGLPIPFAETPSVQPAKLWYLQVGAYTSSTAALDVERHLRSVFSLPVKTAYSQEENLTRVLVGPANSRNLLFAYAAIIKYGMGIEGMVRESAPSL